MLVSPVHGACYMVLVAWTCLSAVFAPVVGATVMCSSGPDHRAVELPHLFSDCAAAEQHDKPVGEAPEHCNDRIVGTTDMMSRVGAQAASLHEFTPWPWGESLSCRFGASGHDRSVLSSAESPPPAEGPSRLASVVLII
jgi:hypothetical protein